MYSDVLSDTDFGIRYLPSRSRGSYFNAVLGFSRFFGGQGLGVIRWEGGGARGALLR